jgi:small neutral amino acid transporter SnatA (MarC family)
MVSPEHSYTKNVANELIFLVVTHMNCFDIWFGCYGILKSGSCSWQILDRLGIQVLDQVFGLQDE